MFEDIPFTHVAPNHPLSSNKVSNQDLDSSKYDRENLNNSQFYIEGSAEIFTPLPISEFAKDNLFHLQAFNIFNYVKRSFTRRSNFHSFMILYTYQGAGSVEYLGKHFLLDANKGILINCLKPHYYEAISKEEWRVAVFHFNGPLADYYYQTYEATNNLVFNELVDSRFHNYLEKILLTYVSPNLLRDLRAAHFIDSLLLYLTISANDIAISNGDVPIFIQQTMEYLERNYAKHITLDDLAKLTSTDKFNLSKQFKRYTGFSPNDYLIRIRIEQAKIILKTTELPACKVGAMVGINDPNNFTYLFKNRVGMTPINYRKNSDYLI